MKKIIFIKSIAIIVLLLNSNINQSKAQCPAGSATWCTTLNNSNGNEIFGTANAFPLRLFTNNVQRLQSEKT